MKGFRETRSILEKECGVKTPAHHLATSRLVQYLKDAMRDTDSVYDLMMGGTVQDSQALDDHLSSLGLLENEGDTEDVNIWDEPQENILFSQDNGEVRAGSLNKLVERLTMDTKMIDSFLMTYKSFTNASTLLEKLIQRFNVPASQDVEEGSAMVIQLSVIDVMTKWMDKYPDDFDEPLRLQMKHFIDFVATTSSTSIAKKIQVSFSKLENNTSGSAYKPVDPEAPSLPPDFFSREWSLLDMEPKEIARQITICDWIIFSKIRPSELMNQSWSKPKLKHRSPNVLAMIKRFNVISNWVTVSILNVPTVRDRARVMAKFIHIADNLLQLNNFNSLMSILGGLNASSVSRLKYTVDEMPNNTQKLKKDLETLMSSDNNFRDYRARITAVPLDVPVLPYLGVYLTDLTFVDENSDYVGGLINYSKRILLYGIVSLIRQRQNRQYNLQPVQQIIDKLMKLTIIDDSSFFKKSLDMEPRGAPRASIK